MSDTTDGESAGVPPAGTGACRVPPDPPDDCPVCGEPYHSVTDHAGGLMVNLAPNERFDRVCLQPVAGALGDKDGNDADTADSDGDGATQQPLVRFYHHDLFHSSGDYSR